MPKAKNQELPAMTGKGVAKQVIPELEEAIDAYEAKKEARCAESPGEIAAKKTLEDKLHKHRDKLPQLDGVPYYATDERRYMLIERMAIKRIEQEDDSE